MVKQRNIFDNSITILRDEKETPESTNARQIIESFNQGLRIQTRKVKGPRTEAPLFGEVNAKQSNLF